MEESPFMRSLLGIAFAAALTAVTSQAQAQNAVAVGYLECRGLSSTFVVGSVTRMECLFRPSWGGRPQPYYGTISRFGLDIGWNQSTRVHWQVYAPTNRLGGGALAGNYVGGSASAAFGIGLGANALFGGSNNTVSLQPVSVQTQTGLSAAAGISSLTLQPANAYQGSRKKRHRKHRH
jgi:hypothetical protein